MDQTLFFDLSYGNYIVSAVGADGKTAGAAMNTVFQLTETPNLLAINFGHTSATGRLLREGGKVAVTVMGQGVPMEVVDLFGFQTSDEVDKFAVTPHAIAPNGAPYLTEHAVSWLSGTVRQIIPLPDHNLFVVEITDGGRLGREAPMTYALYRQRKG